MIPQLQSLINQYVQKEQSQPLTADNTSNAMTAINGIKVPASLLSSVPGGGIAQLVSSVKGTTSGLSTVSGLLNSAVGTAQNIGGTVSSVVGAAAALGLNISAIGTITQAITGVNPFGSTGAFPQFAPTPIFKHKLSANSNVLAYPLDLSATSGIRIGFYFKKYQRQLAQQTPTYDTTGAIFLPVPSDLIEQYGVTYSDVSPGPVGALAAGILGAATAAFSANSIASGYTAGTDGLANVLRNAVDAIKRTNDPVGAGIQAALQYNVGGLSDILGSSGVDVGAVVNNFYGRIINPATTVTMVGVPLREHKFTWTFAPKSLQESIVLTQILNTFKQDMLPTVSSDKFFIDYPMVCFPRFSPNEGALYSFKPCVITSASINHAAGGSPAFFSTTKAPAIISLTITLKEMEMFVNGDPFISLQSSSNPQNSSTASSPASSTPSQVPQNGGDDINALYNLPSFNNTGFSHSVL